ncbi:MAG: hypothetical protein HY343_09030 [Lentisphaerae bacterium]|nr:hypothetical protein [Lentisphaerota bacterium]
MSIISLNLKPTPRQLRQFAALALIFSGIVGAMALTKHHPEAAQWIWGVGGILGISGLILPRLIRPVYLACVVITFPVGFVVSWVLLAAIFGLVLTPIGLLLRLLGRDPLKRRFEKVESYWIPAEPPLPPRRYFDPF